MIERGRARPATVLLADMGAELVVVGGVYDGCGEWATLSVIVLDKQLAPGRHDHRDRFRKCLCAGERLAGGL